jgi:hypothetical protein
MTANTAQTQPGPWVQLPDMTFGVNRYFEFLQRQIRLTGELTATWVSAMNTLSTTVLAHGQVGRSSTTERTLVGSVGLPPLISSARTSQQGTRGVTEPDGRPARQEPPSADVFDEVIELLVEDDIIAAVSEQATDK